MSTLRTGLWVLMGSLAGACSETGVTPQQSATRADSADQVMTKMITQLTDLRGLRIRFLDNQGTQESVLTAERGLYYALTGKLDARGKVMVVTSDGRKLRTEHLVYDKTTQSVESDTSFTYESGSEVGSGKKFKSDTKFRNLTIDQPRGFQKGKGVRLPGPGQ